MDSLPEAAWCSEDTSHNVKHQYVTIFIRDQGDGSSSCGFTITKEPCLLERCVHKSTNDMSPVLSHGEDNDELCFPFADGTISICHQYFCLNCFIILI